MPHHHGKVQEKQDGLELNGTHELPVSADDVELSGEIISTVQIRKKVKHGIYIRR
jgi:hypothetical protein